MFNRSTSNETLANGATIQAALQSYFPSLTNEDISFAVLEESCQGYVTLEDAEVLLDEPVCMINMLLYGGNIAERTLPSV